MKSSHSQEIDMESVSVSPKFQVVIPQAVRERLGLKPGMRLMVVESGGALQFVPVRPAQALRGLVRGIDITLDAEPDRAL
jgi:AbrB family looped-hinge helix DNA binding protein